MMIVFKRIIAIGLSFLLIGVLAFNVRLYYQPNYTEHGTVQVNEGLLQQLAHLKQELHNGAANKMQQIFPEGYVFLNALYALAWVEVAKGISVEEDLSIEARNEIMWVIDQLALDAGKWPFDETLEPAFGIFYRGWCNYIQGRYLILTPKETRDTILVHEFQQNCADIVTALEQNDSPFLQSHWHAAWPADMVVAMASLAFHEEMYPGKYSKTIKNWMSKMEASTDEYGLLPHSVHWKTGAIEESSRGSSQCLMLNFLLEIDPVFADGQFKIFKSKFLDYRIGLPGIREYPKGKVGYGDIDSGPVIWGIGGAASIVGQRTMALYGEETVAIGLRNSIESFGLGYSSNKTKDYLFGVLPIADAFIAWSNAVEAHKSQKLFTDNNWRWKTQLLSLSILVLGALIIYKLWKNVSN